MMSDNNSLMKVEDSFFKRIINWFKNLFGIQKNNNMGNSKFENEGMTNIINKRTQEEKKQFFERYNSAKQGKIDVHELSEDELRQFNIMIEEENRLRYDILKKLEEENEMLELEIKKQEEEKKKLIEMIKKQKKD